jgi:hypothetical protein
MKPLRVTVFPERPESLLLLVEEGEYDPIELPVLRSPFTKESVTEAFREASIPVRVIENATMGRWKRALQQAAKDAKAERGARQHLEESAKLHKMAEGTFGDLDKERANLVFQKAEVDETIKCIDLKLTNARRKAFEKGIYMKPSQFRELESSLIEAKSLSQALQFRLGELRKQKQAHRDRSKITFENIFFRAVKDLLGPEEYSEVIDFVREEFSHTENENGQDSQCNNSSEDYT